MQETRAFAPGMGGWTRLDVLDARRFYAGLFGRGVAERPRGRRPTAGATIRLGCGEIGAFYHLSDEAEGRPAPPQWLTYMAVEAVDEAARQAEALGGRIVTGPGEVEGLGRAAILQDPAGATFAIREADGPEDAEAPGASIARCWNELATRDVPAAIEYYSRILGWEAETEQSGGLAYTTFRMHGRRVAGLAPLAEGCGDLPSQWMAYFHVDDCDTQAEKAGDLGGAVQITPTDIPPVGRLAVIQDPRGAVFSIITPSA